MTEEKPIERLEVVQIISGNDRFEGCFLVVTESYHWGVQGYVNVPGAQVGQAYVRVKKEDYVRTGFKAALIPCHERDVEPKLNAKA